MTINDKAKYIQDELKESAQKIWLAGLGALSMASEEGNKAFKNLVERGEKFQADDKLGAEKMKQGMESAKHRAEDLWSKLETAVNDRVGNVLEKMGVPTRTEINQLSERVDKLMEAIEKLAEVEKKKSAS
jgi:poly(hydroxyalkanoate) granule-associated protein